MRKHSETIPVSPISATGILSEIVKINKRTFNTGFKLSVSQSQNLIHFSTIAMPRRSFFTIFIVIQNFAQNTKMACKFHLYC